MLHSVGDRSILSTRSGIILLACIGHVIAAPNLRIFRILPAASTTAFVPSTRTAAEAPRLEQLLHPRRHCAVGVSRVATTHLEVTTTGTHTLSLARGRRTTLQAAFRMETPAQQQQCKGMASGAPPKKVKVSSELKNFWILMKDNTTPYSRDEQQGAGGSTIRDIPCGRVDSHITGLCAAVTASRNEGTRAEFEAAMLDLSDCPAAVEFVCKPTSLRAFQLPGLTSARVRETSYGTSGLGYALWESGVALSIWLAKNRTMSVAGKSVLELGSGVGMCGIASAVSGASSVVLSDSENQWHFEEGAGSETSSATSVSSDDGMSDGATHDTEPLLLSNLYSTSELNGVQDVCTIEQLDWYSALEPNFVPGKTFDVVIGSDVIYFEGDAEALAATVVAHTGSTGVAYLMNRRGRLGLKELLAFLRLGGSVEEEEFTLFNPKERQALLLVTFRPFQAPGAAAK